MVYNGVQVIIQLKKFSQVITARTKKAAAEQRAAPRVAVSASKEAAPDASSAPRMTLGSDLSDTLSTDIRGLDTSVLGALNAVCSDLPPSKPYKCQRESLGLA